MLLINVINYADRSIIGILLEPIKIDLQLSDTQIGLISGLAFALFYAFAGLAIAYLCDLYSRRTIIVVSIIGWSVMTALTGAANNFVQLFIVRMGIGVGEAGAIPASNSLIADWFPAAKRPLAMAIFGASVFVGVMVGAIMGGYIAEHYGWRWAFVAAATPGIPLAILTWYTLKEPKRGQADGIEAAPVGSLKSTVALLLRNKAYVYLILAFAFMTFLLFGVVNWFPAYLMRAKGVGQAEIGLYFGLALGLGNATGAIIGGYAASVLAKKSLSWLTLFPFILSFLLIPLFEAAVFAPTAIGAFAFIAIAGAVGGSILGPVLASIQTVVSPHVRTTASGLNGVLFSIVGHGGAPLFIGFFSDRFAVSMPSAEALQTSLSLAVLSGIPLTIFLGLAHRAFKQMNIE
ncbi:MAG: MFS transporter [Emcibacter sp.]|nr:MFS transporter [Emcibacter sp.]